jgi:hypothetical protein
MFRKRILGTLIVVVAAVFVWAGEAHADPFQKVHKVVVFPLEGVNVHETVCRAAAYNLVAELRDHGKSVADYRLVELEIQKAESPLFDEAARRSVAEALGADGYLTGSLVALGSQMRFTVTVFDLEGEALATTHMSARGQDDLLIVTPRMAEALIGEEPPAETLTLDNATAVETQRLPQRFRSEINFGPALGLVISTGDELPTFPTIGFDARFELRDVMAEIQAGIGFAGSEEEKPADADDEATADDDDDDGRDLPMHLFANVAAAVYLSHTPVSPYLGAGAGFFVGDRFEPKCKGEGDAMTCTDRSAGVELFPLLGIEFMRHARVRVHFDVRYAFHVATPSSDWAHGPTIIGGVSF